MNPAADPADKTIVRGARDDDSSLGPAVLQACATAEHPAEESVARDPSARDTAAAIPGARLVILPGVGHALPPAVWPTIGQEMHTLADTNADN